MRKSGSRRRGRPPKVYKLKDQPDGVLQTQEGGSHDALNTTTIITISTKVIVLLWFAFRDM